MQLYIPSIDWEQYCQCRTLVEKQEYLNGIVLKEGCVLVPASVAREMAFDKKVPVTVKELLQSSNFTPRPEIHSLIVCATTRAAQEEVDQFEGGEMEPKEIEDLANRLDDPMQSDQESQFGAPVSMKKKKNLLFSDEGIIELTDFEESRRDEKDPNYEPTQEELDSLY